jgi:hypothetical protein
MDLQHPRTAEQWTFSGTERHRHETLSARFSTRVSEAAISKIPYSPPLLSVRVAILIEDVRALFTACPQPVGSNVVTLSLAIDQRRSDILEMADQVMDVRRRNLWWTFLPHPRPFAS